MFSQIETNRLQTSMNKSGDRRARIVVVGSFGVGLTFSMERVPDAGETVIGRAFSVDDGGKGSNQAIGAARLGATVALCTAVGSDSHGERGRALWKEEGVDATLATTISGSTMVGMIVVDERGENRIAIVPGVLDEFTPDLLDGLDAALTDADVLLVGLEIPFATAHAALAAGRRAGVITILNPAPAPAGALPSEMLALVDHLTPNRSEAARLAGLPADAAAADLLAANCLATIPIVALTLGGDGVLLRTESGTVAINAVHVDPVVDTTGAGDSFNAAYAVRIALGDEPVAAARFAVRAAGHCVGRAHVVPSLPHLTDLAIKQPFPQVLTTAVGTKGHSR